MKTIRLTKGKVTVVDDQDYWNLKDIRWHYNNGYARASYRSQDGKTKSVYMHNYIIRHEDPYVVDHINRDGLDNRRENLRIVTPSINQLNRFCKKRGVYPHGRTLGRWTAEINLNGRKKHLGTFSDWGSAIAARLTAETKFL